MLARIIINIPETGVVVVVSSGLVLHVLCKLRWQLVVAAELPCFLVPPFHRPKQPQP